MVLSLRTWSKKKKTVGSRILSSIFVAGPRYFGGRYLSTLTSMLPIKLAGYSRYLFTSNTYARFLLGGSGSGKLPI